MTACRRSPLQTQRAIALLTPSPRIHQVLHMLSLDACSDWNARMHVVYCFRLLQMAHFEACSDRDLWMHVVTRSNIGFTHASSSDMQ